MTALLVLAGGGARVGLVLAAGGTAAASTLLEVELEPRSVDWLERD